MGDLLPYHANSQILHTDIHPVYQQMYVHRSTYLHHVCSIVSFGLSLEYSQTAHIIHVHLL